MAEERGRRALARRGSDARFAPCCSPAAAAPSAPARTSPRCCPRDGRSPRSRATSSRGSTTRSIRAIRTLEKPVVCAVNGVAAGAGANIAFACDIVFAAEDATFIQSFAKIGLIPDSGGTFILPRIVGLQRAAALDDARRQAGRDPARRSGGSSTRSCRAPCCGDAASTTRAAARPAADARARPQSSAASTRRSRMTSIPLRTGDSPAFRKIERIRSQCVLQIRSRTPLKRQHSLR